MAAVASGSNPAVLIWRPAAHKSCMSKATKSTYRPTANPIRNAAMIELRRSGAAGSHLDSRSRRARTRSASLSRAISDQN